MPISDKKGGFIKPGYDPLLNYSGKWTKSQQMQAIAAGTWTGIALSELYAWGDNNSGELGLGDTTTRSSPVQIGALTNWSKPSVGQYHTLATKTDGTLWSWGRNSNGQLGLGDTTDHSSPVQIGALTNWLDVASGAYYGLATTTDGKLYAWGKTTLAAH